MDQQAAISRLKSAWPLIVEETRSVLGGELHYQAIVYHCLRLAGVPARQLGMNVKQMIPNPVTTDFRQRASQRNPGYAGVFETIPDVVLFAPDINGDWRRRRYEETCRHMLLAIEVKASERANARLRLGEIAGDILKLAAHRKELEHQGFRMTPVMMVIDVAPESRERMTDEARRESRRIAIERKVGWMYCSPSEAEAEFLPAASIGNDTPIEVAGVKRVATSAPSR